MTVRCSVASLGADGSSTRWASWRSWPRATPAAAWRAFNARHGGRFRFVHTPLHASWVNQVEIWFSILQRRLLRGGSFTTAAHLAWAVAGFIRHWNRFEAHPFRWTFSGTRWTVDAQARAA